MSHKLLLTLIILLIILILFITSKENFDMLPPDSSEEMNYYQLKDPEILDTKLKNLKESMFERNKYWSFITPIQEFKGKIPKIQNIKIKNTKDIDITKTEIKENNIYYQSDNKDDIGNFTIHSDYIYTRKND